MSNRSLLELLLRRIRAIREAAGVTEVQLEQSLVLGPGWIHRFESGQTKPSVDILAAILHVLKKDFSHLIAEWEPEQATTAIERDIEAEAVGNDLLVRFRYAKHDAKFKIENANLPEFSDVLRTLRDGLAESGEDAALLSNAVRRSFRKALTFWPNANPSDLWYFVILRAYCDPYNHDARFARKSFEQSWKRTGGWALERIFVDHYQPALKKHGINILTGTKDQKIDILKKLGLPHRLEADKLDILLTADTTDGEKFFGMVHVKASFAERRTDDVPMSEILIGAGFTSLMSTMDCKATPAAWPINRGELGQVLGTGPDKRSAKRKDIEENMSFSSCFSYNRNTKPTPATQETSSRVYVVDFSNPEDAFTDFIVADWARIQSQAEILTRARRALEAAEDVG
jgi:transcriptional regulator with XRE-family HTH domain